MFQKRNRKNISGYILFKKRKKKKLKKNLYFFTVSHLCEALKSGLFLLLLRNLLHSPINRYLLTSFIHSFIQFLRKPLRHNIVCNNLLIRYTFLLVLRNIILLITSFILRLFFSRTTQFAIYFIFSQKDYTRHKKKQDSNAFGILLQSSR